MLIDLGDFGEVLKIFYTKMPHEAEVPRIRESDEVFGYLSDDSWINYVSKKSRSVSEINESVWHVSVGGVRTTLGSVGAPGTSRRGRSRSMTKSSALPKSNDNNDLLCVNYKTVSAKYVK